MMEIRAWPLELIWVSGGGDQGCPTSIPTETEWIHRTGSWQVLFKDPDSINPKIILKVEMSGGHFKTDTTGKSKR